MNFPEPPDPFNISRERRLLLIIEQTLDLPEPQRDAHLVLAAEGDAALLSRLRQLIALEESARASLPTVLADRPEGLADPAPPARLGHYVLGELLGRGGMGSVFRARRDDGVFTQEVAIKLMRRSFASASLAAQFALERQILAGLQHPNIARLLDGGVTPDGQSYIVMELLDASPITTFAATQRLGLRERIKLVLPVCAAVAHAHARLVVHADIKPSNVVVTTDRQVRLLDFGVARVLAATSEPRSEPVGMTPDFASPARRAGEPATTTDDI